MQRSSVTEYLDNFLRLGDDIAYVHKRGYRTLRWSYRHTAETAFQFARELEARGIRKGDRVLIWGENCAEWVAAFLGCVLRGAIAVPMDRTASTSFALRVLQQVEAKLTVAASDLIASAKLGQNALALETLPQNIAYRSCERYRAMTGNVDDTVEIVFTSGTTAEPKGVVISHRNILASLIPLETEIAKYIKYERIFHPVRFLNLLPLSHVFGQFLGVFIPQLIGGTVFFQDALNPSEVVDVIKRERISVVVAVPRLVDAMKDKVERDAEMQKGPEWLGKQLVIAEKEHFLRRWGRFRKIHRRFGWKFWAFISGGAALSSDTEEFWRRLGYVVIQGYGMTESTSLISVNHPFKLGRRSIGKVLPGRELKLDENGEILVRGDNIAKSYWVGKELQPVVGEEGWLRTGDLGALDENGNLYFKGRKKNVIVTPEGMNVYPEDLEEALRHQPEIRDCVVIGLAQGGNAEPCAALIPNAGLAAQGEEARGQLEEAVRRANESLAEHQKIRRWMLWPEEDFPRTSTHKPRTNVIQQVVQTRLAPAGQKEGDAAIPASELSELITRILRNRASSPITADSKLEDDLNLSSLDRVELMSAIEDRYLVDVDESSLSQATTVGQLEEMLRSHRAQEPGAQGTDQRYPYSRWAQRWPFTWIRPALYYLFTWPATMLLGKPRVIGRERVRNLRGPALFIANHVTSIDIGFLQAALPARYRTDLAVAMSGELLRSMRYPPREWNFLRRWFEQLQYALVVALFNVLPLPQKSNFRHSFDNLGKAADLGYSIVVFPEGKRTTDGAMSPFRNGIGLLAQRLNLPIVPMRIDGLYRFKAAGRHIAPPHAISVRFGDPIRFPSEMEAEAIAQTLQTKVAEL